MSWTLETSGHGDEHQERELAHKLGQVLEDAKDVVHHVHFTGTHVNGDIRRAIPTGAPKPAHEEPLPET